MARDLPRDARRRVAHHLARQGATSVSVSSWCTTMPCLPHAPPRRSHRPPRQACINQADIAANLACLPVFLSGCRELLCLAGATYATRLWVRARDSKPRFRTVMHASRRARSHPVVAVRDGAVHLCANGRASRAHLGRRACQGRQGRALALRRLQGVLLPLQGACGGTCGVSLPLRVGMHARMPRGASRVAPRTLACMLARVAARGTSTCL